MADIYVRKRGKGSRISKPKWIHINPKKFKKIPPSDNVNGGKQSRFHLFTAEVKDRAPRCFSQICDQSQHSISLCE